MNEEAEKGDITSREEAFVPKGAIALFLSMLTLFVVVWLLVYTLMLHRS